MNVDVKYSLIVKVWDGLAVVGLLSLSDALAFAADRDLPMDSFFIMKLTDESSEKELHLREVRQ